MKITKKEYNQIIHEIAERVKDLLYINLENNLKKQTTKKFFENLFEKDSIDINYTFGLISEDVKQIFGRIKRKKYDK